jgi:hypothetical protein
MKKRSTHSLKRKQSAVPQRSDVIKNILDHPRMALVAALILAGLSLSGRFSVTATRLVFFAAWIVAAFSFWRFAPLRSRPRLFAASVIGFGCCLFFLGLWAQPDAVPQYFGTITPRTRILFSSASSNLPRLEFGDSGAQSFKTTPPTEPMKD